MEETGKQQGKEVENEDTSNSVKERAISPLHLGMPLKSTTLYFCH